MREHRYYRKGDCIWFKDFPLRLRKINDVTHYLVLSDEVEGEYKENWISESDHPVTFVETCDSHFPEDKYTVWFDKAGNAVAAIYKTS